MNKETFWKIIDEVNSETNPNDRGEIVNATQKKLMNYSPKEIIDWHSIKQVYMNLADRNDLWAACTATHTENTLLGFKSFRAWLISQGKEIYMNALADPDSLADIEIIEGQASNEEYEYTACRPYSIKTVSNEGVEKLLSDYSAWVEEESDQLVYEYGRAVNDISNPTKLSKHEFFTRSYEWHLSEIYDLYDAVRNPNHNIDKEIKEIMAEIEIKPDLSPDWDINELSNLLPRLCEKYELKTDELNMNL